MLRPRAAPCADASPRSNSATASLNRRASVSGSSGKPARIHSASRARSVWPTRGPAGDAPRDQIRAAERQLRLGRVGEKPIGGGEGRIRRGAPRLGLRQRERVARRLAPGGEQERAQAPRAAAGPRFHAGRRAGSRPIRSGRTRRWRGAGDRAAVRRLPGSRRRARRAAGSRRAWRPRSASIAIRRLSRPG